MQQTTRNQSFDFIVAGVGSMGSAACYYLAKRGYSVLGLEQFTITHDRGSHSGQTRIIRKAYFEHPDYIPLLQRAYENWKSLELETGEQLYYPTGLLYAAPTGHSMLDGVKNSAALYNINLEQPDAGLAKEKFPQFNLPDDYEILFEPDAGFLLAEKVIKLYVQQAQLNGATIHTSESVLSWKKEGDGVVVTTTANTYHCKKLIITAGAWSAKLLPGISKNLTITRQVIAWMKPKKPVAFAMGNFPCWLIATEQQDGTYYGFPMIPSTITNGPAGMKMALHYPGAVTDPHDVDRNINTDDTDPVVRFLHRYLPNSCESVTDTSTCLYSNSPDENFIIDNLPGMEDAVCVAGGFSGHGFKFVSVVGEILADLASTGTSKLPIGFLNARRFG